MTNSTETRLYTMTVRRDELEGDLLPTVMHYLCTYHRPVIGGTLTPADAPPATIATVSDRAVTQNEVVNYGAGECDCCRRDVVITERKDPS